MSTPKHAYESTFDFFLLIKQSLDFQLIAELLQLHQEPETQIKNFHWNRKLIHSSAIFFTVFIRVTHEQVSENGLTEV